MNNILPNPEIEAEIYYLTESEGGRGFPVHSRYRGQFNYNDKDWDALQEFVDKEICNPGESVRVKMHTLSPDYHIGHLSIGHKFKIKEGNKTIGNGVITNLLRKDFSYWDPKSFLETLSSNINPYSGDDLIGFKMDFDILLEGIDEIQDVAIIETGQLDCMLKVICKFIDYIESPRSVVDKIIECWKEDLALTNHLYKVYLDLIRINNGLKISEFNLTFATWGSLYLTGQITIEN